MVIVGRKIWPDSRFGMKPRESAEDWRRPTIRVDSVVTTPSKRLLFVNQYYWPDHASTAQHLADLAEHLAARGHEVHVLCGQGAYKPGTPKLPAQEMRMLTCMGDEPRPALGQHDVASAVRRVQG